MKKNVEKACIKRLQQVADVAWNGAPGKHIGKPSYGCCICREILPDDSHTSCCLKCPVSSVCYGSAHRRRQHIYNECHAFRKVAVEHYLILQEAIANAGLETELEDVCIT